MHNLIPASCSLPRIDLVERNKGFGDILRQSALPAIDPDPAGMVLFGFLHIFDIANNIARTAILPDAHGGAMRSAARKISALNFHFIEIEIIGDFVMRRQ